LYFYGMFVREKRNKSGVVSVQVIDKSGGRYKVAKTIGSSSSASEIARMVLEGERYINSIRGAQEIDFYDYRGVYRQVLSSISTHKLVGVRLVLGGIFEQIGFHAIEDDLFRDLVLYRIIYPKSKLKTTEYLYRFEQKNYSEDDVYRYMDKLNREQKERVQQISFNHTESILPGGIRAIFYDVTTVYFEIDNEDELRKTGFSKEGKHQHPQIVLGLLVSHGGYPLAYDIFEGNKFEGHTMLPVLNSFRDKYRLQSLVVVADSGLLSQDNITQLIDNGYEFILGARLKAESQQIKEAVMALKLKNGESAVVEKGDLRLVITFSEDRAKKDRYNREKGLKRLERLLKLGKLNKSAINNRGYNKFLKMEGEVMLDIDYEKLEQDKKWDGLKGYLTNSNMSKDEILQNYQQLWQIERAFRVTKTDLKIRPIYHYKKHRIEAHICLNFAAYKVYKELERQLKEKKSKLSPEKVIEIIQNIYQISVITPQNEVINQLLILTEEQKEVQKLFNF
jgi:transposase